MTAKSRTKGAVGEREIIYILQQHFPYERIERNFAQAARGGCDFVLFNQFACEVKRYQRVKSFLTAWWDQACDQAIRAKLLPALFYRFDRQPWQVVIARNPQTLEQHKFDSVDEFVRAHQGRTRSAMRVVATTD